MQATQQGGVAPCHPHTQTKSRHYNDTNRSFDYDVISYPGFNMPQGTDPLDGILNQPVALDARAEIVRQLWGTQTPGSAPFESRAWDAYFSYYRRESSVAFADQGKHTSIRTHRDLLRTARLLEDKHSEQEVKTELQQMLTQQRSPAEEQRMLEGSLRLATRLLLMVNTGPLPSEASGDHALGWNQGSLQQTIHDHFDVPVTPYTDPKHEVLGIDFTCRNVEHVADIEIVPTNNLLDHLRLVDRDKKLYVFQHVTMLKAMQASSTMFPDGFVAETLETLALLLPDTDRKTKRWLEDAFTPRLMQICMDRELLHCGHFKSGHPARRLGHYRFWRDRLESLRDAFEEATPPSRALMRVLMDRKQGDRWLNSWVALVAIGLTLFFGLVQSIEGAIQVYKAYHPVTG